MPGKKADAEAFASKWANKGIENQDTQRLLDQPALKPFVGHFVAPGRTLIPLPS